jgi:signal transduction histidine kinase
MIWQIAAVAGGILTVAVLVLFARNLRHSQALREEKATLRGHLNASPFACLILQSEGWWLNQKAQELLNHPDESPMDTSTLLACINAPQKQALSDCLDALRYDRKPFSQSLETSGLQRAVYLTGMWSNSCAVLWMQDEGATLMLTERMAEMERRALFLEKLLDAVPMPIWWRDPQSLDLSGSNNAYNTLLGVGDDPSRARDLARLAQRTGMAQTESRHLVLDGSRVAIDVTEAPVQGFPGAVVGIGRDMTALENLQMSLAEHISVQDQVLERLTSAIAIYGPDRRLKFYNTAYAEMWSLTPEFLDNQPSVSTVLETLRQRGTIPETSDFPAYKKSREALFTHLIDAREDMIHLLNGRTVHAIISPHPLGGLIYQYQDVTDQLALETSHNELIAVQRSTLNSLFEGVCVFGRDGRLKLFNSVFANMFDLDIDWLAQSPHISAAAEKAKGKLLIEGDWDGLKQRIITRISEPKARQGRMLLSDMRVLDYAYVPLPDGQCLLLYLDVTDTTRVAEALRERNRALENADLLKSQFIANMSYELRTPLNAIMGFAELLKMEMFGTLSDRQTLYVDDILSASTDLSELIGEILDLAAVQAGFMELDLQKVDIAVVMQDIVQVRIDSNSADQKAVVFDAIHPAPILADMRRINQALNCFMDDALYVLDRRDTLSVAVAHMEDQQICLTMTVPIRNFDEPSWAKSICGLTEKGMLEPSLATGADIGISLARSLIAAQGGSLSMTDDSQTLICKFPACPADV